MNLSDEQILEIHELLDCLVENNLSSDQKKRLEKVLAESNDARKIYVSFMDMHASLCHYAQESLSDLDAEEGNNRGSKIIELFLPLIPLAAVLLFGVYIFFSYKPFSLMTEQPDLLATHLSADDDQPVYVSDQENEALAVLTNAVGLQWIEDTERKFEVGAPILPGSWKMKKGVAQVEFMQGATVIFEGFVHADFVNSNAATLHLGKMRAHVPKVAVGFSVDLPMGKVIDLGTDFGIHAHEDGSAEVYVYRGKVKYQGNDITGHEVTYELSGGEALYLDKGGVASLLDMPSGNYLGTADLAIRSMEQAQKRMTAWHQFSQKLSSDPQTLLYYAFENHDSWARILRDETQKRGGSGNGAVIGCKWTEGRWPGKGALQFSKNNDRVCLNVPTPLSSVTMCAWVKVDRMPNPVAPIMFTRPHMPGAVGWSLNRNGQLVLAVNAPSGLENYSSPVALTEERMGKWNHLATSFDANEKWVNHFVNGRSFSREKIGFADQISLKKGLLGHTQAFRGYNPNVALEGSIDEFVIFNGAWPEEQIRELYEVGAPVEVDFELDARLP